MITDTRPIPPVRYGRELEGRHIGAPTVILLDARLHKLSLVERLLKEHGRTAVHVWVETQPGQTYDWDAVREITKKYAVTALVRRPGDVPPAHHANCASLVWDVPEDLWPLVLACSTLRVLKSEFRGFESALVYHRLKTDAYAGDELWLVTEDSL